MSEKYLIPERGEQLYVKRGRRYVAVTTEYSFPCEGVFSVSYDESRRGSELMRTHLEVEQIGGKPEALEYARVFALKDAIIEGLRQEAGALWRQVTDAAYKAGKDKPITIHHGSLNDMAQKIIAAIYEAENKDLKL